ncbi:hypothetical protein evm_008225 [Chilo suppressalis]|nr:hypothetical protein evm_008225 [Chilo suppressalis]
MQERKKTLVPDSVKALAMLAESQRLNPLHQKPHPKYAPGRPRGSFNGIHTGASIRAENPLCPTSHDGDDEMIRTGLEQKASQTTGEMSLLSKTRSSMPHEKFNNPGNVLN